MSEATTDIVLCCVFVPAAIGMLYIFLKSAAGHYSFKKASK